MGIIQIKLLLLLKAILADFSTESDSLAAEGTNCETVKLQQEILLHQSKAKSTMDEILCELDKKPCDQDYFKALVKLHNGEIQSVSTLTNVIDSIYERELSLLTQRDKCNKMTATDKYILADEFGKLSSLVNLNI